MIFSVPTLLFYIFFDSSNFLPTTKTVHFIYTKDYKINKINAVKAHCNPYLTITYFQFLDSFAFLGSSLDTLVNNLKKDGKENFKHTLNYKAMTEEQQSLILQKGTYPYEYMDTFEKFDETQLPSINKFFNTLGESECKEDTYRVILAYKYSGDVEWKYIRKQIKLIR